MKRLKQVQWNSLLNYVGMGRNMARQYDASFVLIAVAEVEGKRNPTMTSATQGIDESSEARSEATIAALEHVAQELRARHKGNFGKEPTPRTFSAK